MLTLLILLIALPLITSGQQAANQTKIVTAAQVNGTWKSECCTFKVLALGNQKLKVQFDGTYKYTNSYGPTVNTGYGIGIAHIEGDTAIFKPESADDDCKITMQFTNGKLVVDQDGTCGFGFNVNAADDYHKVSNRKPSFDEAK